MSSSRSTSQLGTVVITGGASGIGLATARALSANGARVVLAVRNVAKGGRAAAELGNGASVEHLDLADLSSVRRFAAEWDEPIDVLINNAGITSPSLQTTTDGFEMQFGTNTLGPYALTNLLLPHITGRVVTLASLAERQARLDLDDLGWERTPYKESRAYANSKFADLVFTSELQRRLTAVGSTVRSMAAHPGFVATPIYDQATGAVTRLMVKFLAQSPADGALPVVLAATGDLPGDTFTGPEKMAHMRSGAEVIGRSKRAHDPAVGAALWNKAAELTGVDFGL